MAETQDLEYESELAHLYGVDTHHNFTAHPFEASNLSEDARGFLSDQGEVCLWIHLKLIPMLRLD